MISYKHPKSSTVDAITKTNKLLAAARKIPISFTQFAIEE
jgi:hypothetical protein